MLRFIGAVVVLVGLVLAIGVYTNTISISGSATVTQMGEQEIKNARDLMAEVIRGK
jgi:hypothetical protein